MNLINRNAITLILASSVFVPFGCSASINIDGHQSSYHDIDHSDVNVVLDEWHHSASVGDLHTYIQSMTEGAVFMGTDESERWTRDELQSYAEKYFKDGQGWTYHPRDRFVRTNAYGDIAWVDETLDNDKYGTLRGTAVLRQNGDEWRIAHYSLTFLIPNDSAKEVVRVIKETSE